jgi:DNA-directed RNA polymerase I, II, and III subunit RPABC1
METAYKICLEMFSQRGYDIIEEEDEQILANKKDGNQVIAFISQSPKFNVEKIQEYISIIKKMYINHCIIVFKDNATPVAKKVVEELTDITIELFHEDEMQYNITKHVLVPLHEIEHKFNTKECENFKKKYGNKFPIILKSDPVSRFYGYDKGDIIKITRKNGYITYRLVK